MKYILVIVSTMFMGHLFSQYTFNQIEIWPTNQAGSPRYYEEMNGDLYFQARNNYNTELWKTDGTQGGTQQVADLNGTSSSSPYLLKAYNNELIFVAGTVTTGTELWKSDGTIAGTMMLKDIWPGSSSGFNSTTISSNGDREGFIDYLGELFFFGNTGNGVELWKTDGTSSGTVSVKNFNDNGVYGNGTYNYNGDRENVGVIYNNEMYFLVSMTWPIPLEYRGQLWKTDGTAAGTMMVRDSLHGAIHGLTAANDSLYFVSNHPSSGEELWSSDGTYSGTQITWDINSGTGDSDPDYLMVFNDMLLFRARGPEGIELYKIDDTVRMLVKDIYPGAAVSTPNSALGDPRFVEYNGEAYFIAEDGSFAGTELWKTDGTELGTVKVVTGAQTGLVQLLKPTVALGKLFFASFSQLWETDGTAAGTQQLTDTGDPQEPMSQVGHLAVFQQNLWFTGANNFDGAEAWFIGAVPPTQVSVTMCETYTVPSGDETYTVSGVYADTLLSGQGMDSILLINLTIENATSSFINASVCDQYTSPSGNYVWSGSGTYMDTIMNAAGCDSIITIQLSVNHSASTITEVTCDTYTSPSGVYTWNTSGNYQDTVVNSLGCDSVITIQLTIQQVDVTVQNNSGILEAVNSMATYQWLDCLDGYAIIPGETSQSFNPGNPGQYAVEITVGNCTDTSSCIEVLANGLLDDSISLFKVYPNPSDGIIHVEVDQSELGEEIQVIDVLGKEIHRVRISETSTIIELPNVTGIMFVIIGSRKERILRL